MKNNLVIKNAQMPDHCWNCEYTYDDAQGCTRCIFTCEALNVMGLNMTRRDDCPLEEVTQQEELEITTVLDRRTSSEIDSACNVLDHRPKLGNFVTCHNCGKTMLVNTDAAICPECEEDTLNFVDTGHHQVNDTFFAASAEYVLCDTE